MSDLVRLIVIYENGGIYFDTDVEVIKPLDDLLQYKSFFGFENMDYIATGLGFGAIPNNKIVKAMINKYDDLIPNSDGSYNLINCPLLNSEALGSFGFIRNGQRQSLPEAELFPQDFFNPYNDLTGKLSKSPNTYSIH